MANDGFGFLVPLLRALRIVAIALAVLAVAAWPLDWVLWRIRLATGSGMDAVVVAHYTVTAIKGGKDEYFSEGVSPEPCSRSVFPEAGAGPCWWLNHTKQLATRI
jgi:hypothetical protein